MNVERLKELVIYDPESGLMHSRVARGNLRIGSLMGSVEQGYLRVRIEGKRFFIHRLAWLYSTGEWPRDQIDHIDGNPINNRLSNLRQATSAQNGANSKRRIHNKSGYKGVSWNRETRMWCAFIWHGGKNKNLGSYTSAIEAHLAYANKAQELRGEFARTK